MEGDANGARKREPLQRNEYLRRRCSNVLNMSHLFRMSGVIDFFDPLNHEHRLSLCAIAEVFFPLQRHVADLLEDTRQMASVALVGRHAVLFWDCNWTPYYDYPCSSFLNDPKVYTKYCEPMCIAAAANARFFATWMFEQSGVQPWWECAIPLLRGVCYRNWTELLQRIAPVHNYSEHLKNAPSSWSTKNRGGLVVQAACLAENITPQQSNELAKTILMRFRFDKLFLRRALWRMARCKRSVELLDWQWQEFGSKLLGRALFETGAPMMSGDDFSRRCVDVLSAYGSRHCGDSENEKKVFLRCVSNAIEETLSKNDLFPTVLDAAQWCIADVLGVDASWNFHNVLARGAFGCVQVMVGRCTMDIETARRCIIDNIVCRPNFLENVDARVVGFVLTRYDVPRSVFVSDGGFALLQLANRTHLYPFSTFICVVEHYDIRGPDLMEHFRRDLLAAVRDRNPDCVPWLSARLG